MKIVLLISLLFLFSCRTNEGHEETIKTFYKRLFDSRGNYSDIEDFVITNDVETTTVWEGELETIRNKKLKKSESD